MEDYLRQLNRRIDHTLLAPDATAAAIERLCDEAVEHDLGAVVINPAWVAHASMLLETSGIAVVSVAGFPLGAARTDIKVAEASAAVEDGASEIDMVAAIGLIVDNSFDTARREIETVRRQLPESVILKVIIEASLLTTDQQAEAARAVADAGANFVKTSTGFFGGATVDQVRTLHEAVHGKIGVKASGGIRTLEQCRELLAAGASRLGTSASVQIMRQYLEAGGSTE
ncbi:MAG: deoxyribose-phosphate aldolase [Candidatus Zixiibacteriota bacterium]|jgi:deoxyribose-phosphate aldolase